METKSRRSELENEIKARERQIADLYALVNEFNRLRNDTVGQIRRLEDQILVRKQQVDDLVRKEKMGTIQEAWQALEDAFHGIESNKAFSMEENNCHLCQYRPARIRFHSWSLSNPPKEEATSVEPWSCIPGICYACFDMANVRRYDLREVKKALPTLLAVYLPVLEVSNIAISFLFG